MWKLFVWKMDLAEKASDKSEGFVMGSRELI